MPALLARLIPVALVVLAVVGASFGVYTFVRYPKPIKWAWLTMFALGLVLLIYLLTTRT